MNNANRSNTRMADPSNDGENFSNKMSQKRSAPTPKKKKMPKHSGGFFSGNSKKILLIGAIAAVAIILVAIIVVALIFAPSKSTKIKDNAYMCYTDTEGIYHILSNGKQVSSNFKGEVKLVPAKDLSFTYVIETITDEEDKINVFVLKGTSLEQLEITPDDIIAFSDYAPGIVYEDDDEIYYYSPNHYGLLSHNVDDAQNFIISKDAKVVAFNDISEANKDKRVLKYFCEGVTNVVSFENGTDYDLEPKALAQNGKYIYITSPANIFGYIEMDPKNVWMAKKPVAITKSSSPETFEEIVAQNADGMEIIFCAKSKSTNSIESFRYKIANNAVAQKLADGKFQPISIDPTIIEPQTFIGTYFTCTKLSQGEEFEETVSTYYLDRNSGAKQLAPTVGQFSPDQKYFYYLDIMKNRESGNLNQIALSNKDFVPQIVKNDISDFRVVDKGNLYLMDKGKSSTLGKIHYSDPFKKNDVLIASNVDLSSISMSGNSIYFLQYINENEDPILCVSTNGSKKVNADFKNANLTAPVYIDMATKNVGYAILSGPNDVTVIYYTKNGKKFNFITSANPSVFESYHDTESTPNKKPESDEDDE